MFNPIRFQIDDETTAPDFSMGERTAPPKPASPKDKKGASVSERSKNHWDEEEDCSEALLRRVSGEEDLSAVRALAITVDTTVTQVDHLGTLMPSLAELRLKRGSMLSSFRDLGSSLATLRVLWLSACGVRHLDGVGALTGLEELYLAFNDIDDLTSIALHDHLEVLDLESNDVEDADQVMHLGTCPSLCSLTLAANPLCRDKRYRRFVVDAVPHLVSLDDEDVTGDDRRILSLPGQEPQDVISAKPARASPPIDLSCSRDETSPPQKMNSEDHKHRRGVDASSLFEAHRDNAAPLECQAGPRARLPRTIDITAVCLPGGGGIVGDNCHTDVRLAWDLMSPLTADKLRGKQLDGSTATDAVNAQALQGEGVGCWDHHVHRRVCTGRKAARDPHKEFGRVCQGIEGGGGARCGGEGVGSIITSPRDVGAVDVSYDPPVVDEERVVSEAVKYFWRSTKYKRVGRDTAKGCLDVLDRGKTDKINMSDLPSIGEDSDYAVVRGGPGGYVAEVLRLPGMISTNSRISWERKNTSSALTHGCEVSIAGNPAFGLRRRRVSDRPTPTVTGRSPSEKSTQQKGAVTKSVSSSGPFIQRPATTGRNLRRRDNSCVAEFAFGGRENPSEVDEATRVEKARVGHGKSAESKIMFQEDYLAAPPTGRDATVDRGDDQVRESETKSTEKEESTAAALGLMPFMKRKPRAVAHDYQSNGERRWWSKGVPSSCGNVSLGSVDSDRSSSCADVCSSDKAGGGFEEVPESSPTTAPTSAGSNRKCLVGTYHLDLCGVECDGDGTRPRDMKTQIANLFAKSGGGQPKKGRVEEKTQLGRRG